MALGLLEVNVNSVFLHHTNPVISKILHKHKKLFDGMENLKGKKASN